MVLDPDSGQVKAVVNARALTALRNAAGSLLSAKLVGPLNPTQLVLFGAGSQIRAHVLLFTKAYPSINRVVLINRTSNERIQNIPHDRFILLSETEGIKDAVSQADLIVTATPSTEPLFDSAWVKEGAHVMLIGSYTPTMREVDDGLFLKRARGGVLVESREACSHEAGELLSSGIPQSTWIEVGEMVLPSGELTPKGKQVQEELRQKGNVTVFKSVGLGVQDVTIASAVVEAAEKLGKGTVVMDFDA